MGVDIIPVINSCDTRNILTIPYIVFIVDEEALVAYLSTIQGVPSLVLDPDGWIIASQMGSLTLGKSHTMKRVKHAIAKDVFEVLPATQMGFAVRCARGDSHEAVAFLIEFVDIFDHTRQRLKRSPELGIAIEDSNHISRLF
jgi:hypothetical protein